MPTSSRAEPPTSERTAWLVDSSVAVALVSENHPHHELVQRAVSVRRLGLAGHAAFETFSVLSRFPAPLRQPPEVIGALLRRAFPATVHLGSARSAVLLRQLAEHRIGGGAVFDALGGA